MGRIAAGSRVPSRELQAIDGSVVRIPDPEAVVHLQFRRFAGCPICHLHVHQLAERYQEIRAAGIREVVLFHSAAEELRKYQNDLPFDVIGDPERRIYDEFGVGSSIKAVLSPKAMAAGMRGLTKGASLKGGLGLKENHLGFPADFLIDTDGTVLDVSYGAHANDQWTVDELLAKRGSAVG